MEEPVGNETSKYISKTIDRRRPGKQNILIVYSITMKKVSQFTSEELRYELEVKRFFILECAGDTVTRRNFKIKQPPIQERKLPRN